MKVLVTANSTALATSLGGSYSTRRVVGASRPTFSREPAQLSADTPYNCARSRESRESLEKQCACLNDWTKITTCQRLTSRNSVGTAARNDGQDSSQRTR